MNVLIKHGFSKSKLIVTFYKFGIYNPLLLQKYAIATKRDLTLVVVNCFVR